MQALLQWFLLVSTCLFAILLLRARLAPRPFFGGLFALALVPFMSCASIVFVRMREVAAFADGAGRFDPDNLIQRLHEAGAPFRFGVGTTAVLLVVHLLFCVFTRPGLTTRSSEQRLAAGVSS